jgi:16S rRNA C967 or C1407 C5-methylase (RsmB/RsmF family)
MQSLAGLQRRILRETLPLLSPTGSIVFSTCSLEPGENERQVKVAASKYDLELQSTNQEFPTGLPGDAPETIQDGGFYAILSA